MTGAVFNYIATYPDYKAYCMERFPDFYAPWNKTGSVIFYENCARDYLIFLKDQNKPENPRTLWDHSNHKLTDLV